MIDLEAESMVRAVAAVLDHVYMGGPSERSMRNAKDILQVIKRRLAMQEPPP